MTMSTSWNNFCAVIGVASGLITLLGVIAASVRFHYTRLPQTRLRELREELHHAQSSYTEWEKCTSETPIKRLVSNDIMRLKDATEGHVVRMQSNVFQQYIGFFAGQSSAIICTTEKVRALRTKIDSYIENFSDEAHPLSTDGKPESASAHSLPAPRAQHTLTRLPPSPISDGGGGKVLSPTHSRGSSSDSLSLSDVDNTSTSGISNSFSLTPTDGLYRRSVHINDGSPSTNPGKGAWRVRLNEALQKIGFTLRDVRWEEGKSGPDHSSVWTIQGTIALRDGGQLQGRGDALQKDTAKETACRQLYEGLQPPPSTAHVSPLPV